MMNGQVKVQGMPDINKLPATARACSTSTCVKFRRNRINPHVTDSAANAHQAVLATKGAENVSMKNPWQHKVTLTRSGQSLPSIILRRTTWLSVTPARRKWQSGSGIFPHGDIAKNLCALKVKMDSVPVLSYVNDYGAGCRCILNVAVIPARWM